jgi:ectoine hydroxylase-related dioxygenase (phytanoyl-CoA dioxygenase family)
MKLDLEFLRTFGYAIVDDMITDDVVNDMKREISHLISLSGIESSAESVAHDFAKLAIANREKAGKVFDSLKNLPSVNNFIYSYKIQQIFKEALDSKLLLFPRLQQNCRADHPGESKFSYPWHNDLSYNGGSVNSYVIWIPLDNVNEDNGSLHVIPSSQNAHQIVTFDEISLLNKRSAGYFVVENIKEIIDVLGEKRVNLRRGQGVIFHSKLLHKSGENNTEATRLALQIRCFDAKSKDAVNNHWKGGIDEGIHPMEYLNKFF